MSASLRGGDPARLSDLDGSDADAAGMDLRVLDRGAMAADLRIARAAKPTYDVDAGLARFSALVALAPAATSTGAATGATATGATATGATATGATTSGAATSGAATSGASTATGAAKLAVATKLGFGMKAIITTIVAAGSIGVVAYGLSTSNDASEPASGTEVRTVDGPRGAQRPTAVTPRAASTPSPERESPSTAPEALAPDAPREEPRSAEAPTSRAVEPARRAIDASSSESSSASPSASSAPPPGSDAPAPPSRAPGDAARGAAAPSAPVPASNAGGAASVRPEMEHLAKTRGAGSPAEALRLAEEGHRLFPRGVFWQEREAIAIDALSRLGRSGDAATRARAFLAANPHSAYAEKLRRIAGE